MKKFKLSKKDIYDLASVMASVVREQSEKLDFKEVIHLQKTVNQLISEIKDFSDEFDKISKDKQLLVEVSNKKISEYKQKLHKKADEKEEIDESYKEKLDNFVQIILDEANEQISKEISPQYDAIYSGIGENVVEIELSDDKYSILVINFEKYAKEKYTNKSKMVEIYETLVAA